MMNKIGILGGTFDPIHKGHVSLALQAYKEYKLDKVLVMISPMPPHKANTDILDITKRIDMVKLAIQDFEDKLVFSDFELNREGYVYTADTLTLLKQENPDNEYYFIMGGDSIRDIEKWYHPEIIMENAVILVAVRQDMDYPKLEEHIEKLKVKYTADIHLLHMNKMPISSTYIRENIYNDDSVIELLPEKVYTYIKEQGLYNRKL